MTFVEVFFFGEMTFSGLKSFALIMIIMSAVVQFY